MAQVHIHLQGDASDHDRVLAAIQIAALLDWTDLALDTAGLLQPIPPEERARLIDEAERRAAGGRILSIPPAAEPVFIRPITYACPNNLAHPKHISFEDQPVPKCSEHEPPIACREWQPGGE